eukprot:8697367-Pyramimonas_sp.AAC.1
MQETWVYSHNGPIIRRKHGYILKTDQSYAGSTGIFSRRTHTGAIQTLSSGDRSSVHTGAPGDGIHKLEKLVEYYDFE